MAVTRGETILPDDLPLEIRLAAGAAQEALPIGASENLPMTGASCGCSLEADRLLAALNRNRWKRAEAAKELGLSRSTLWRRMRELHLIEAGGA